MSVNHHVRDDLLAAYATGELAEGWGLAIATHLALCPDCRRRVARFEATAGDLLEAIEPAAPMPDTSWQAIRERLDARSERTSMRPAMAGPPGRTYVFPEPLRSYLGADAAELKWKPLGRGAYQVMVPTGDAETTVRLLRIPAGKPVPEHGHGGRELTLVLAGSFSDRTGEFRRGDLEDADDTLEHQPVAGPEEDCICLAVTDAPLRFKSRLLRLVQPLLGI